MGECFIDLHPSMLMTVALIVVILLLLLLLLNVFDIYSHYTTQCLCK